MLLSLALCCVTEQTSTWVTCLRWFSLSRNKKHRHGRRAGVIVSRIKSLWRKGHFSKLSTVTITTLLVDHDTQEDFFPLSEQRSNAATLFQANRVVHLNVPWEENFSKFRHDVFLISSFHKELWKSDGTMRNSSSRGTFHLVHLNAPRDWFEINSRHQKRHSN